MDHTTNIINGPRLVLKFSVASLPPCPPSQGEGLKKVNEEIQYISHERHQSQEWGLWHGWISEHIVGQDPRLHLGKGQLSWDENH